MSGVMRCTYDGPADDAGRRTFTLEWYEPDGVFRPELGPDGEVVGYRRGQVFRAVPAVHFERLRERGWTVEELNP